MDPSPDLTFDAVYAEYADPIYRYCYRLCGRNAAEAEDVAQETWLRVHRSLGTLRDRATLRTWLYTVARREWIRLNRSPLRTVAMSNQPGSENIADPAAHRQIDHLALQQCLARLSQPLREAIVLVKMEGFTHQEAAIILERPQGTVQYQVAEALKRLRKMLVDEGRLASVAPLALLEGELRQWGESSAPAHLRPRIDARRNAHTEGQIPGAGLSPLTRGRGLAAVADLTAGLSRRKRWLVAVVLILAALVVARYAPWGRRFRGRLSYPERVVQVAERVRTAHAVGTFERFRPANARTPILAETLEYWFQSPDRYRIDVIRGDSSETGPTQSVVTIGDRTSTWMMLQGRVQALFTSRTNEQDFAAPLSFLQRGGPLNDLLRSEPSLPALQIEENGADLRLLTVQESAPNSPREWRLYIDPQSGRVVRVQQRATGVDRFGVQSLTRIQITSITYDAPVASELFTVPARPAQRSRPSP